MKLVRRTRVPTSAIAPHAATGTADVRIADTLGCSRSVVQARRAAEGVPSGRAAARAARLKRVRELHREGLSDREIGQQTGDRKPSAVAKDRRILNLPANYRGSRAIARVRDRTPRGGPAGPMGGPGAGPDPRLAATRRNGE